MEGKPATKKSKKRSSDQENIWYVRNGVKPTRRVQAATGESEGEEERRGVTKREESMMV